jgi:hypothetical protein
MEGSWEEKESEISETARAKTDGRHSEKKRREKRERGTNEVEKHTQRKTGRLKNRGLFEENNDRVREREIERAITQREFLSSIRQREIEVINSQCAQSLEK